MASTYSPGLGIELPGTGDQAGVWGNTTNTNLGTLIEQAISGYVTQAVATGTDTTITIPNGATGVARNMYIELTGSGGASTNLIVPANKKLYFIFNNTSSGQVTVKVAGQTGISVPNGKKMILVSNGTDIVTAENYVASLSSDNLTLTGTLAVGSTSTFTGAATFTANPTLSAGTANGVLYLNGSKVATSGSALTFDGTNLALTTANSIYRVPTAGGYLFDAGGNNGIYILGSSNYVAAYTGGTERMRLTSSVLSTDSSINLGIGTATPSAKLEVRSANSDTVADLIWAQQYNAAGTDRALFTLQADAANNLIYLRSTGTNAGGFLFISGADEVMRLSSSGNLTVGPTGVTGADGISVASGKNFSFGEGSGTSYSNIFRQANSAATIVANGYKYSSTANGFASSISSSWAKAAIAVGFGGGDIRFYTDTATTVTNGTDVTPTLRATLTPSGSFGINTDTPLTKLDVRSGYITSGTASSNLGTRVLAGFYTDGALSCWGTEYSSGGPVMGYAVWPSTSASDAFVSASGITIGRGAYTIAANNHKWYIGASQTVSIGSAVSMTQAMTLDASGRLGIGTSSPVYPLVVSAAGAQGLEFDATAVSSAPLIQAYNRSGSAYIQLTYSALQHVWQTSGTERARIDSSGNLGVGIAPATTSRRLVVYGSTSSAAATSLALQTSTSGTGATDGFTMEFDGTTAYLWNYENNALIFGTNNTERARITSGGDLLVGTTTSNGRVSIESSGNTFYVRRTAAGGVAVFRNGDDAGYGIAFQNASGGSTGSIYWDATNTTYATSSDYRLKNLVGSVSGSGQRIDALNPVEFEWKTDGSRARGFFAHEFQNVYPSSVSGKKDDVDENGNAVYQSMQASTTEVIADLVAEIQSLRQRVAALEAK